MYHADDLKATTKQVDFQIHSVDGSNHFEVRHAHTVPRIHLKRAVVAWSDVLDRWPHLHGLKYPTHKSNYVTVIIGYDHPDLLEVIKTPPRSTQFRLPTRITYAFRLVRGGAGDQRKRYREDRL